MIARLEGRLAEKGPERVVLDVGGVGYEVLVPLSTFLELPDEGKTVQLRVHTYVREDSLRLYGFLRDEERSAFGILLSINGVGPRLALAILSGLPVPRLVRAVRSEDVAAFGGVPGVGVKKARRLVVELRDRVDALEVPEGATGPSEAPEGAVSALLNLGYPRVQAEQAVRRAGESLPDHPTLENLIREALRVSSG